MIFTKKASFCCHYFSITLLSIPTQLLLVHLRSSCNVRSEIFLDQAFFLFSFDWHLCCFCRHKIGSASLKANSTYTSLDWFYRRISFAIVFQAILRIFCRHSGFLITLIVISHVSLLERQFDRGICIIKLDLNGTGKN